MSEYRYSSQYYDPAKAHEYYEKHKQLKGRKKAESDRKSTKGLNEKGKAAAAHVKETIAAEKKAFMDKLKEQTKEKIAALRDKLKHMSKEERKKYREKIREEIAKIRSDYKAAKDKAKADFSEKYLKELDDIKKDKSFRAPAKTKKRR